MAQPLGHFSILGVRKGGLVERWTIYWANLRDRHKTDSEAPKMSVCRQPESLGVGGFEWMGPDSLITISLAA